MKSGGSGVLRAFEKVQAQLPYLPQGLALVWKASRRWTVAWSVLLLVQSLLPVATVYLTKSVVDRVVLLLGSSDPNRNFSDPTVQSTLWAVVGLALVSVCTAVAKSLTVWVRVVQAELTRDHIAQIIQSKSATIDLGFFETREYHDKLSQARGAATTRVVGLLENAGNVVQNAVTLVAMAGVVLNFGFGVALILLASGIPAFIVVLKSATAQHSWFLKRTMDERRAMYFESMVTSPQSAAEVRLFNLGPHFMAAFRGVRSRLRMERFALARSQALREIAASLFATASMGAAVIWVVARVAQGQATPGDAAMIYQAFNQSAQLMRTLLDGIGQVYSNVLFLESLFGFLDIQPSIVDPKEARALPIPMARGLAFENVTFTYQGREKPALDAFSVEIPAGSTVAIVGSNGAGKSTLLKLICRLYDPTEGRLTLDGVDIRAFRLDELRRQITVLFQDPVKHQESVTQNIAYGDITTANDSDAIRRAANEAQADAVVAKLPKGFETTLGRWFEGAELSGGEWQRIALARAFLRKAPIIVLDEPTSAMDSWAEASWLDRFREIFKGHTVVIITHRFTTAMRASKIHVMDAGKIVESGTHEELVALGGIYAKSWEAQMRSATADATKPS